MWHGYCCLCFQGMVDKNVNSVIVREEVLIVVNNFGAWLLHKVYISHFLVNCFLKAQYEIGLPLGWIAPISLEMGVAIDPYHRLKIPKLSFPKCTIKLRFYYTRGEDVRKTLYNEITILLCNIQWNRDFIVFVLHLY